MNLFTKLMAGKVSPDDFLCVKAQELFLDHIRFCPVCREKLQTAFQEVPMLEAIGGKILGGTKNG